jgi:hypothetical protein
MSSMLKWKVIRRRRREDLSDNFEIYVHMEKVLSTTNGKCTGMFKIPFL